MEAHESVAGHLIDQKQAPIEFVDTAGCGFAEAVDPETLSTFNAEEGALLFKHLIGLTESLDSDVAQQLSVGVIAPYKAQVERLEALEEDAKVGERYQSFSINTVDAFQGQERDIIYISLVRSNDKGEIGFLSNTRRMNVALTRAKKKLVVVGDSATLGHYLFYYRFFGYIHEEGTYKSAYEWMF